jgi:hypothetical protein
MAATYSSFMTTRFYSPVFNTALFDGPLRIYFSQNYEALALKMYHLFQSEYIDTWNLLKTHSVQSKEHLFVMIYPEANDLQIVFENFGSEPQSQEWVEGMAVGVIQVQDDAEIKRQLEFISQTAKRWIEQTVSNNDIQV